MIEPPIRISRLRSATDAVAPTMDWIRVVSAVMTRQNLAGAIYFKERRAQADDAAEQLAPDIGDDTLAKPHHKEKAAKRRDREHGDDAKQDR